VGAVGGAGRAEFVAGPSELGLDAVGQKGFRPRAGADLSAGIWIFDVYAEGVLQRGTDRPVWKPVSNPVAGGGLRLEATTPDALVGAVAGGCSVAFNVTDKESLTMGVEYFYQGAGVTRKAIYPWLLLQGQFTPFYLGRDYAAAYAFMGVPGTNGNQVVTLSNLANLSDHTAIARLDWTATIVTHLRLEVYAAGHYGAPGGEFRFGGEFGGITVNSVPIPAVSIPAPLADAGVGLNLAF
jgi:hypothetical protein